MAKPKKTKKLIRGSGLPDSVTSTHLVYKPEYADQVYRLALLGLSELQIAQAFDTTPQTLVRWFKKYPEFHQRLIEGRLLADGKVAKRLYERAIGFEFEEEQLLVVAGPRGSGSSVERHTVNKFIPPDVGAAKFWLTNRQRKLWADRVENMNLGDPDLNDPLKAPSSRLTLEIITRQEKPKGDE